MKLEYYKHLFDGAASDGGDGGADNGGNQGAQGAAGGGASSTGNNDPGSDGKPDAGAKKYTDADVDALFAKKFAALMQKHERQQAAAVKEAERLAKMSAQERAEHERDELQAKLDALQAQVDRAEMMKAARDALTADGVTAPDNILELLIGKDAETTQATCKAYTTAFKKAVQKAATDMITGGAGTPKTGGATALTRADIMKEPNTRKRQELIKQNMNLFR